MTASVQGEADRLARLFNLGNKVTACRELAFSAQRDELYPLVKQLVPEPEHQNFTRLFNTFVNRQPQV